MATKQENKGRTTDGKKGQVMTEIKLTKRYPHSRTEDITDAFMRGYEQGKKDGLKVGKQIVLGAFETYITADRKTEPNCSEKPNNCDTCRFELYCPEMCEGCCEWDSHYEPKDEPQKDLLVTEYPQDGEVNLIGRDKTEAVVMAYDVYKELTEPWTDYKKWEAPPKVDLPTGEITTCVTVLASALEIEDEPQTDKEIILDPSFAELSDEQFVEAMKLIEPQTDCSWK